MNLKFEKGWSLNDLITEYKIICSQHMYGRLMGNDLL